MKSQLKIDHLLSKSVNGMIMQVFSYITAYIIVNMIIESIGILLSFTELTRGIRHGSISYFNNIYNLDVSRILLKYISTASLQGEYLTPLQVNIINFYLRIFYIFNFISMFTLEFSLID
jgi:hypothetical protein